MRTVHFPDEQAGPESPEALSSQITPLLGLLGTAKALQRARQGLLGVRARGATKLSNEVEGEDTWPEGTAHPLHPTTAGGPWGPSSTVSCNPLLTPEG